MKGDQEIVPAKGHDYSAQKTLPSCTKGGYTSYSCARCADNYVADLTAKLNHRYGAWTPNGDGTHSRSCLREGCGSVRTAACEAAEVCRIADGEKRAERYVLCPVCGELEDGSRLELVELDEAVAVDGTLPNGRLTLRVGALENGEGPMSLCLENGGRTVRVEGAVQFTLPVGQLEGYVLMLLGEEGAETELPITVDGEEASFTLEFAEEGEFYALIRLVPAE